VQHLTLVLTIEIMQDTGYIVIYFKDHFKQVEEEG